MSALKDYAAAAQWYRDKAEEAGIFIERMATAEAKRMMMALSRDFLRMAEILEGLAPTHRSLAAQALPIAVSTSEFDLLP